MCAVYYVDGAVGDDANGGTAPGAGNAWATVGHALATAANGDTVWVKASAVYSISTGLAAPQTGTSTALKVLGYSSATGDGGRPTIQATAAITGLTFSGDNVRVENFILDGNSTGTIGVAWTYAYTNLLINCLIENWTTYGLNFAASYPVATYGVEVTGCGVGINLAANNAFLYDCHVHGNAGNGIQVPSTNFGCVISRCRVLDNGGAGIVCATQGQAVDWCIVAGNAGRGIDINSSAGDSGAVRNCTVHNNGGDGIRVGSSYYIPGYVINNIVTANGGYGINTPAMSPGIADDAIDYNWFGSGGMANTSGARNVILAGPHDISGDPQYADAAAGDFTPQNPAVQAAYPDGWIGAVQPASTGGGAVFPPIGCGFIRGKVR